jgi:hypothetical protein
MNLSLCDGLCDRSNSQEDVVHPFLPQATAQAQIDAKAAASPYAGLAEKWMRLGA